jgi:hypothetical protein
MNNNKMRKQFILTFIFIINHYLIFYYKSCYEHYNKEIDKKRQVNHD